jgi:hypothetical protein
MPKKISVISLDSKITSVLHLTCRGPLVTKPIFSHPKFYLVAGLQIVKSLPRWAAPDLRGITLRVKTIKAQSINRVLTNLLSAGRRVEFFPSIFS